VKDLASEDGKILMAKECPNWRRLHPETAPRCQCGHDFESGLVKQFDYLQLSEAEIEEELKDSTSGNLGLS